MQPAKCDNASAAHAAKIQLRRNVLGCVSNASVLDCFCGHGEMWRGAWVDAAAYVGCDQRPVQPQDPPRFWCDNLMLLRSLDLRQFNVFDLDAYGSPWSQMIVIAARRLWKPGELGAVVITDGSNMHSRYGGRCAGLQDLLGVSSSGGPTGLQAAIMASRRALRNWTKRSRVQVRKTWQARGNGSGLGQQVMVYTAIAFEGLPDQA
jgi:hypothetical protein